MTRRHVLRIATATLTVALVVIPVVVNRSVAAERLPMRLTDQEFWKLSSESSEPGGTFHSENLVSNEIRFQTIVPSLARSAVPGRAYVGVGSEQNFTYIAATRPAIAFVIDIRRGNLDLHLIYKVLFEIYYRPGRVRIACFPEKPPATAASTVAEIFAAFRKLRRAKRSTTKILEIKTALTSKHGFQLSSDDLKGLDFVCSWFRFGIGTINGQVAATFPYSELMTATDAEGKARLPRNGRFLPAS
jgi:hypothetical protein